MELELQKGWIKSQFESLRLLIGVQFCPFLPFASASHHEVHFSQPI